MWQEVLAVDSRLCAARKMDKELRPLYLKRRMQLIKAAEDEYEASQLGQVRTNTETPLYSQLLIRGTLKARQGGCVNSHHYKRWRVNVLEGPCIKFRYAEEICLLKVA